MVDDLTVLVEIIRAGGITAASRATGISKSSLSRRIADLENELGVQLILRGPRNFAVTEIGQLISMRGERIQEELETIKAIAENATNRPSGNLKILCPAVLAEKLIADYACSFSSQYPDVHITLDSSAGKFEPELGPYDLAIQPSTDNTMTDSELIQQRLISAPYRLVASPALVEQFGTVQCPEGLSKYTGIGWAADGFLARWRLINNLGERAEFPLALRFSANNLDVIKIAAINGLGIARLPLAFCREELRSGQLVQPLPDWFPPPIVLYGLYPSRRSLTFAGRLFLAGLARNLQDYLAKDED